MKNIGRFLWFGTGSAVIPITVSAIGISLFAIIPLLRIVSLLIIISLTISIPLLIIVTLPRIISLLTGIPLLIIALLTGIPRLIIVLMPAIIALLLKICIWLLIKLIVHIFPSGPFRLSILFSPCLSADSLRKSYLFLYFTQGFARKVRRLLPVLFDHLVNVILVFSKLLASVLQRF